MLFAESSSSSSSPRSGAARSPFARRPRWAERIIEGVISVVALVSIAGVVLILLFVGKEALPLLTSHAVKTDVTLGAMLGGTSWRPVSDVPSFGILPLLTGTLKVTLVALGIA